MKKKVVIGAPMWSSIRDLLRSEVLDNLISKGCELLIITPNVEDEKFKEDFSYANITFKEIIRPKYTKCIKLEKLLNSLSNWFN